ncbi:cobalamin biosynthesis protein [Pseudonocardia spinosispora]|uniref:cobalamin biosynthesis protein n=1 Tax=Pseudonocardia spinosispora TaxID=103441 RepID=UPI0004096639|nr:cobalamin biosynthesis protein [Pseudonocardia spinosispora]
MSGARFVVGLGCRRGVDAADVEAVVRALLEHHGVDRDTVQSYATLDARADEPGLRAVVGDALRTYSSRQLASVSVPNPSTRVSDAVGTPSVAEAAALYAAGELASPGSTVELIGEKLAGTGATAALARISATSAGTPSHG